MEEKNKLGTPTLGIVIHAEVKSISELEELVSELKKIHQEYICTLDVSLK